MATKTLVQSKKSQQLSSISIMLEYDIDNTLNTIKENSNILGKMPPQYANKYNDDNINKQNEKSKPLETQSNTSTKENLNTNARKRWKILAKALRHSSEEFTDPENDDDDQMASVRRFKTFDVVQHNLLSKNEKVKFFSSPENWYTYKLNIGQKEYFVNIHHMDRQLTATDLMGFNNTGNICVWPSEEALTVYVLAEVPSFNNKWILELGGGMTCLAGIMIAKYAKPYAVHLTDGNCVSVENVQKTICLNEMPCYTKCSVLKWEYKSKRTSSEREKFDYILSADCLFFDDARSALVDTIFFYLSENGTALIMAPQRGKTLTMFVEECISKGFICQILHKYNEIIWQKHIELQGSTFYDEDIHYPVLIKLTKPKTANERN